MSNSATSWTVAQAGFLVLHYLLESAQVHVHWVDDAIQPSHPLSSPSPAFKLFRHQSFQMSQLFISGGQSTGASASASVLSMNIQDWFPLGLTGLISLQSKGLSKVFSNTTVQKHQFLNASLLYGPYMKVKVTQSCQTLFNPMDYTVHGILQARILEWIAFPFSRGSGDSLRSTQGLIHGY